MTSAEVLRPVQKHRVVRALTLGLALSASGCGWVEHDPHRFEQMAERVAAIPVSLDRPGKGQLETPMKAADMGLREARPGAVRVEVMDPHDLWEARDGAMEGLVQAAAPAIAEAAVDEVEKRVAAAVPQLRARPVSTHREAEDASLVQLGAFGSEASARTAWARIRSSAPEALAGLTPRFEPVTVDGRSLVRLKVAVPASGAAAVCAAARIRATMPQSALGTKSAKAGEPIEVGMPATSARSLTAKGMPCSQPLRGALSAAFASAISVSGSRRLTTALMSGFTRSIWSSVACISSAALIWRVSSIDDSSSASRFIRSSIGHPSLPRCRGQFRQLAGRGSSGIQSAACASARGCTTRTTASRSSRARATRGCAFMGIAGCAERLQYHTRGEHRTYR